MPGIADAPVTPLNLQGGSSAEIGGAVVAPANINPGVGDLFAGFKSGFITADDIKKRAMQRPVEQAQAQQALADTNLIRPKQREVAGKALDVQSQSLDTQAQTQPKLDEATFLQAEKALGDAQRGGDKNAILNFYQTVAKPGQLPPKLDPSDPSSDYDYAKIQDENAGYLKTQRELQSATALGKFVKTFSTTEKDAQGNEKQKVVRLNELTGQNLGSTEIGTSAAQSTPILAEELNRLTNVDSAYANVQDVKKAFDALVNANPSLVGPVAGRLIGPAAGQYNALYQQLENAITKTVPGLARGVFGEVGVLTDADVNRYKSLLPSAKKDPAIAVAIFKDLEDTVTSRRALLLDNMEKAGRDVSKFRKGPATASAAAAPAPVVTGDTVAVTNPSEAPATAKFIKSPDGRVFKNPNYKAPVQ